MEDPKAGVLTLQPTVALFHGFVHDPELRQISEPQSPSQNPNRERPKRSHLHEHFASQCLSAKPSLTLPASLLIDISQDWEGHLADSF